MDRKRRVVTVDVKTRTLEGIRVAHVISVSLYLIASVGLVSIVGGTIIQLALTGTPGLVTQQANSTNSVTLTWTAPGDDANVGTASRYSIRYAATELSEATWLAAPEVADPPTPLAAGSKQTALVTGLTPGTLYSFGIKTYDEAENASQLSNIASKRTALQACVPIWSCTEWSKCVDGNQTRTCTDISSPACGNDFNRPLESQTCTSPTPEPTACKERWSCSEWSACRDGVQTRVCQDLERCGTTEQQPETTFDCSAGGQPPDNPRRSYLLTAQARGGEPLVKIFRVSTGKLQKSFYALPKKYRNGLSIAGGDIDGDGIAEVVVGTGTGSSPQVSVFSKDGRAITRFYAYPSRLRHGVNVAVADVNGDGRDDVITVPATGFPSLVRVYRYDTSRRKFTRFAEFSAFDARYRGGSIVAAGDLDRNGLDEVVVTPVSEGTRGTVLVYEYNVAKKTMERRHSLQPYGKKFRNGIETTIGDINGDGNNELITVPAPGATDVRVFNYAARKTKLFGRFFAGITSFRGGADLASLDVDADGDNEILTTSYLNGLPGLRVFTRNLLTRKFDRLSTRLPAFLFRTSFLKGVRIATIVE